MRCTANKRALARHTQAQSIARTWVFAQCVCWAEANSECGQHHQFTKAFGRDTFPRRVFSHSLVFRLCSRIINRHTTHTRLARETQIARARSCSFARLTSSRARARARSTCILAQSTADRPAIERNTKSRSGVRTSTYNTRLTVRLRKYGLRLQPKSIGNKSNM